MMFIFISIEDEMVMFVIDYEILSTVIRTVPLLWNVQKLSVPCENAGN
jgi:hypothetical protein